VAEPNLAENGHQFHFEVDVQGAHRSADGPYVDEERPAGLPFRVTVRAWNLRDACLAAAKLALGGWTQPDENGPGSFELVDAAAERGHNAMFEGELAADGIERDLWRQVVLAVLADPRLLPHWARAARVDADNWHRQCNNLDIELERLRAQLRQLEEHCADVVRRRSDLAMELDKRSDERDERQARIDRVLALHTESKLYTECGHDHTDDDSDDLLYVDEIGTVCEDGYMITICRACCCTANGDQSEECANHHDGPCWPCPTHAALAGDQPTRPPLRRTHALPRLAEPATHELGVGDDTSEPAVTPPDLSGRILDGGPIEPFTAADHEELRDA